MDLLIEQIGLRAFNQILANEALSPLRGSGNFWATRTQGSQSLALGLALSLLRSCLPGRSRY
jgi:hypothetical protein